MQFWFLALCISSVSSAEDETPPSPSSERLFNSNSDVMAIVAQFCNYSALCAFGEVASVPHTVSRPLVVPRRESAKQESLDDLVRGLNDMAEHYQKLGIHRPGLMCIPLLNFDARKEIRHYLNGFEGHIDLFASEVISIPKIYNRIFPIPDETREFKNNLRAKLDEHKSRFRTTVLPLHQRPSDRILTEVEKALFDAFIEMKKQTVRLIESQLSREYHPHDSSVAKWKLFVENIGVIIGYPTLNERPLLKEIINPDLLAAFSSRGRHSLGSAISSYFRGVRTDTLEKILYDFLMVYEAAKEKSGE